MPRRSFSGIRMRLTRSAATAVVSADTELVFEQTADVVWARYRGGRVVEGHLVGRLTDDTLHFRYVQADSDGNLDAGVSDGRLEVLENGRYRLTESFQWTTRPETGTNVFDEITAGAAAADVAMESAEQTHRRLSRVIRESRLEVYEGDWAFEEFPITEFQQRASPSALALVRDDATWSQLVPYRGSGRALALFRFHFSPAIDNSGFVGWLASQIKATLGSGVVVICGSNSQDGGIFDYWAVPAAAGAAVIALVRRLVD